MREVEHVVGRVGMTVAVVGVAVVEEAVGGMDSTASHTGGTQPVLS
jgi:hypothetical protein